MTGQGEIMRKELSAKDIIFDTFNVLFMIAVFIIMLYPFIYILSYSLSEPSKVNEGLLLFPVGFNISAYRACFKLRDVANGFAISFARTIIGPSLMIFFTSMAAYAISREDMLFVKFFRKYFIFTMYFSGGLIPMYLLMKTLRLTNSFWVYIIPSIISVFNMVLIRAYIENLPKELEDAAVIDGANEVVLFFRILLPLCKPVIAAVTLFACIGHWNSYIDTQLYNSMKRELYTLQYVLYNYLASTSNLRLEELQQYDSVSRMTPKTIRMAITVITIVPIACVYPFLQGYFTSGLLIGSIKA
jgi:putative aldouronate transport system permease protein